MDIPEDTSVIYACAEGSRAVETRYSSSFVDAFAPAVHMCAKDYGEDFRGCRLDRLVAQMNSQLDLLPSFVRQEVSLSGSGGSRLLLPVSEYDATQPITYLQQYPVCTLQTRSLRPHMASCLVDRLENGLRQWLGYDLGTRDGVISTRREQNGDEVDVTVEFQLPKPGVFSSPSAFLIRVLDECYSVFFRLKVEWPALIPYTRFAVVSRSLKIEYRILDDEPVLLWNQRLVKGQGVVSSTSDQTELQIECRSVDGWPLALEHLLPSLAEVLCQIGRQAVMEDEDAGPINK